jgi:hypothetical protein
MEGREVLRKNARNEEQGRVRHMFYCTSVNRNEKKNAMEGRETLRKNAR